MKDNKTIKDLKPADYNPRKVKDSKLQLLKKTLKKFGNLSGIVKNIRTGNLVGGHQRVKVIPYDSKIEISTRYDPPTRTGTVAEGYIFAFDERFDYREVDWSLEDEKAANIAANNLAGEWDDMLSTILTELKDSNFDMELTGFETDEIDKLIKDIDAKNSPEIKEWELDDITIPFWAVIRCPINKVDKVKAALAAIAIGEKDIIIETSL